MKTSSGHASDEGMGRITKAGSEEVAESDSSPFIDDSPRLVSRRFMLDTVESLCRIDGDLCRFRAIEACRNDPLNNKGMNHTTVVITNHAFLALFMKPIFNTAVEGKIITSTITARGA
jgi:hypothetical protein